MRLGLHARPAARSGRSSLRYLMTCRLAKRPIPNSGGLHRGRLRGSGMLSPKRDTPKETSTHDGERFYSPSALIESYLYEWTRGVVGPREVDEYFPPGSKAGIRDKWKDVPKELAVNQKIRAAPSLGGSDWVEFRQLVTYRDGLVHANASRATSDAKPDALPPVPSPDDLRDMEPGWPVRVVADLVRSLHAAVGSSPPHWLVNPQWVAKPAVSPPSAIEVGSRRDATARWRLYSALHGPR